MNLTFACGHSGKEGHSRLCPHLVGVEDVPYARVLRGKGLEADVCCAACTKTVKAAQENNEDAIAWQVVSQRCVELLDENEWDMIEWIGQPGIEEQPVAFDQTLTTLVFEAGLEGAVALVPLDSQRLMGWWNHTLFEINQTFLRPLCEAELVTEKGTKVTPRLHVSLDEEVAVLCHDFGRFGVVVDLQEKRTTMRLDKGNYRNEHTPFPAAFFRFEGQTLLVHATDWNRLDVSDPRSGQLLSSRTSPSYRGVEERPQHYLDYFHGQLHVSPDEQWIADDGWVWAPVGVVASWNIARWIGGNVWESEDGVTRHRLCERPYLWNIPVAWIDAEHVAVWELAPTTR